jgi:hypothetical protein
LVAESLIFKTKKDLGFYTSGGWVFDFGILIGCIKDFFIKKIAKVWVFAFFSFKESLKFEF